MNDQFQPRGLLECLQKVLAVLRVPEISRDKPQGRAPREFSRELLQQVFPSSRQNESPSPVGELPGKGFANSTGGTGDAGNPVKRNIRSHVNAPFRENRDPPGGLSRRRDVIPPVKSCPAGKILSRRGILPQQEEAVNHEPVWCIPSFGNIMVR